MKLFKFLISLFFILCIFQSNAKNNKVLIYKFEIKNEIDNRTARIASKAFSEAEKLNSDYILIHLNTYGGLLDAADSIRTRIINSKIPVIVFIDNNAASAGALISIACDKIFMRTGANIGAATVVDGQGNVLPDKYQAYMRAMMRSTAESHGQDTIIKGSDTTFVWKRNPQIAESMVDKDIYIKNVIDSGKVLTFTTSEAIKNGYCEGSAENIDEVIKKLNLKGFEIVEYKISTIEHIILLLLNPYLQGVLIMLIIGGIYFELQSPGMGFPSIASIGAAILYFAPLYLDGFAANWEILIFVAGLLLVLIELFAIPGFGVAGVSGIVLIITGLALSMVENFNFEYPQFETEIIFRAFFTVIITSFISIILSIYFGQKLLKSSSFSYLTLKSSQNPDLGFVAVETKQKEFVGKIAIAFTVLRPSGKIMIEDKIYDAISIAGYIEKNEKVKILSYETGQLNVIKIDNV